MRNAPRREGPRVHITTRSQRRARSLAVQSSPPLTSVHQPVAEMGRQMARMLVAQINGQALDPPYVLLSTDLVRRQSA